MPLNLVMIARENLVILIQYCQIFWPIISKEIILFQFVDIFSKRFFEVTKETMLLTLTDRSLFRIEFLLLAVNWRKMEDA